VLWLFFVFFVISWLAYGQREKIDLPLFGLAASRL
jgi:hypothetical protein